MTDEKPSYRQAANRRLSRWRLWLLRSKHLRRAYVTWSMRAYARKAARNYEQMIRPGRQKMIREARDRRLPEASPPLPPRSLRPSAHDAVARGVTNHEETTMSDRAFSAFACVVVLLSLAFYGGLAFVAIHFIGKFW